MKKYFIAVAALAFLAACNGKAAKDTPVLVEEESIAVAEAAPDVLIINPSLTDEEMLRELQQKSLRLIAFQSALADARLMQLVDEGHEVLRRAAIRATGRLRRSC